MLPVTTTTGRNMSHRQRGAALIVSLMILLIMTIIGISAMSTTTMEERMSDNNKQRQLAFQAAETALRTGEAWLAANINLVTDLQAQFVGANGLYAARPTVVGGTITAPGFDIYDESAWSGNGVTVTTTLMPYQPPPRYIIEYVGRVGQPPLDYTQPDVRQYGFRITAIGWGTDSGARYMAWSNFRRKLN